MTRNFIMDDQAQSPDSPYVGSEGTVPSRESYGYLYSERSGGHLRGSSSGFIAVRQGRLSSLGSGQTHDLENRIPLSGQTPFTPESSGDRHINWSSSIPVEQDSNSPRNQEIQSLSLRFSQFDGFANNERGISSLASPSALNGETWTPEDHSDSSFFGNSRASNSRLEQSEREQPSTVNDAQGTHEASLNRGRVKFDRHSHTQLRGTNVQKERIAANRKNGGRKPGGRKPGSHLSEEKKENAKLMREETSCLRCSRMKEQCSTGTPCTRCDALTGGRLRKWSLGCIRLDVDKWTKYLVSDVLQSGLRKAFVDSIFKDGVRANMLGPKIELPIWVGFGVPLKLYVVEIEPLQAQIWEKRGLEMKQTSQGQDTVPVELKSPPILPVPSKPGPIQRHVYTWMEQMIIDEDSNWPAYYFSCQHELWLREIMAAICRLFRREKRLSDNVVGRVQTLRMALMLTVLNFIMTYVFVVPEDEVESFFRCLQHPSFKNKIPEQPVSPRIVNAMIKQALIPLLKKTVENVLTGLLRKLLWPKKEAKNSWDISFAVAFLTLSVIGKTQVNIVESARYAAPQGDDEAAARQAASKAREAAWREVQDMETQLSRVIIDMFHEKFGTNTRHGKNFNPLAASPDDRPPFDSDLAKEVREVIQKYRLFEFQKVKLCDLRPNEIREKNVQRLILKFMAPFFF